MQDYKAGDMIGSTPRLLAALQRIAALYEALSRLAPSPIIDLNHAVAVAFAVGPAAGLELVDALTSDSSLKNYYLLSAVRGDLLKKLGRHAQSLL
jgi:predicted RNA polymerase sigma factor